MKWTAVEEVFGMIRDSDYLDDIERRFVCLVELNKERNPEKGTMGQNTKPKTLDR